LEADFAAGLSIEALQSRLPAGAARNAVDCAYWDLLAKINGQPAWQLAGVPKPQAVTTAYTLSLAEPEVMLEKARQAASRPLLKVKLGTDNDLARIEAVRMGAPNAQIIVDANEGWTPAQYEALAPSFVRLGVAMVEQPFPAKDDDCLSWLKRVLPVCADESCHDSKSLCALKGKYDLINIKLDKTGGLTEALKLKIAAEERGFKIMVGCMIGSSLAMAPAQLLTHGAAFVDLDAPLLLGEDRPQALIYEGSEMQPASTELWG